jgi:hypothetical protein
MPDSSYLSVADADALAATLVGLTAYLAADDTAKAGALNEASAEIDAAMPYQGRKYADDQVRQFPRVHDDLAADVATDPATIWDWDADTSTAIVPDDVLRATLYQADAILAGARQPRIDAQHDGVVYELTGGLAESYKATPGQGVRTGLCHHAWLLMRRFRLRSGRLV